MSRTKRDRADRNGPVPGPQNGTPARAVEPYEALAYVPHGTWHEADEWLTLRPTARNDREEGYYRLIVPVRAMFRFGLWITYRPERPVILLALVAAFITIFIVG